MQIQLISVSSEFQEGIITASLYECMIVVEKEAA